MRVTDALYALLTVYIMYIHSTRALCRFILIVYTAKLRKLILPLAVAGGLAMPAAQANTFAPWDVHTDTASAPESVRLSRIPPP